MHSFRARLDRGVLHRVAPPAGDTARGEHGPHHPDQQCRRRCRPSSIPRPIRWSAIHGIEVNHGAAVAPDGSRYYISNEGERTLDVVDQKTLKVTRSIPLSGHPNNIAISKDGRESLCLDRGRAGRGRCHRHSFP